ncbi:hypothetical protein CUMW_030320 [Citrus unshiu]|nr:hypothetical protein CUMW_030320 [Citrus unshiu]
MVKELSRGASCTYISRTGCTSQHWRPLIKLQSDPRVFQGSLFQKYPQFSTTAENDASHGSSIQKDMINVTFVDKDIEEKNIKVPVGMSMLEVHVKARLPAQHVMSHLGCQIVARPELDGICLALPAASRNFAVDGFVPKPR